MSEKKKSGVTKALVTAGIILLIIGLVCCIGGMTALDWRFEKLSNLRYEYNAYSCEEKISQLCVDFENADIRVTVSESAETAEISYPVAYNGKDEPKTEVTVTEENGKLNISEKADYGWKDFLFNINWSTPKITITLPEDAVCDLELKTDKGTISVEGGNFGSVSMETSLGNVKATGLTLSENGNFQTNAGDVILSDVVSQKNITAETDLGDVRAEKTQSAQITLNSSCGDIKTVSIVASTIELSTSCGDIRGSIAGKKLDYRITASTSLGNNNLSDGGEGEKSLRAHTDLGDIHIEFTD